MRTQKVWLVYVNNDLTEGRGPMVLKEVCATRDIADAVALANEPYGHRGQFTSVGEKLVLQSIPDYEKQKKEQLIASIKSKLTAAERAVVGL